MPDSRCICADDAQALHVFVSPKALRDEEGAVFAVTVDTLMSKTSKEKQEYVLIDISGRPIAESRVRKKKVYHSRQAKNIFDDPASLIVAELIRRKAFKKYDTYAALDEVSLSSKGVRFVKLEIKEELKDEAFLQQWSKDGRDTEEDGRHLGYNQLVYQLRKLWTALDYPGKLL